MKRYGIAVLAVAVALSSSVHAQEKPKTATEMAAEQAEAVARAQQKVAAEADKARRDEQLRLEREVREKRDRIVPLDIEIVISRYQGDKKVSSLPYELTVNAIYQYVDRLDDAPLTSLRMGGRCLCQRWRRWSALMENRFLGFRREADRCSTRMSVPILMHAGAGSIRRLAALRSRFPFRKMRWRRRRGLRPRPFR
jgi:hypothetical protein